MPPKKTTEDKITIKQFKDGSSNWFVNNKHYHLDKNGLVSFICGGIEDIKEKEYLEAYIKRNKKCFKERSSNIFEQEEINYSVVSFGKYAGKTTQHIVSEDKRYANWLYETTQDGNLKEELKILLKK